MPPSWGDYFQKKGRKGGLARKRKLTPERRKEIAQKAARHRWDHVKKKAVA
jgi:hypothetical protein